MSGNMASEQVKHLNMLREERTAREKARIDKLREMNLKKYSKPEPHISLKQSVSNVSVSNRSVKSDKNHTKNTATNAVRNSYSHNNISKRPITAPAAFKKPTDMKNNTIKNAATKINGSTSNSSKNEVKLTTRNDKEPIKNDKSNKYPASASTIPVPKMAAKDSNIKTADESKKDLNTNKNNKGTSLPRKSMTVQASIQKTNVNARKSLQPRQPPKVQTTQNSRESVFDRLYKPKPVHKEVVHKEAVNNAVKLQTDPNYLKKIIKDSNLVFNKRHTMFGTKTTKIVDQPVRRSISAVHLKRISKSELSNCIHKWASIGEKLNKVNLSDVNEDDCIKGEVVVSAVKSERKRVKFQTPVPFHFNTPKPEELQSRLQSWLQKRGKALDSFHHLQCFGIHHLPKEIKPLNVEPPNFDLQDDENKENVPLESDSDDDSFSENMNKQKDDLVDDNKIDFNKDKWRTASNISDSATDYNESTDTITSNEVMHHVDELLLGALNDLTQLLKEGFDWEQCARWLRAIRDRFPSAPNNAAYWECRAALEERRGDLPASVQCWEEAIAMGTEHSVVEANLDQLLDKFLQLRISPSSGKRRQADTKMLDVKNVFKSTIIRFAVQQAKLRQSNQSDQIQPKFTVTPVRRSGRLSTHLRTQTPLRICASVKQACELGPMVFRPNRTLSETP